jgi:hypothetical protein
MQVNWLVHANRATTSKSTACNMTFLIYFLLYEQSSAAGTIRRFLIHIERELGGGYIMNDDRQILRKDFSDPGRDGHQIGTVPDERRNTLEDSRARQA